MKEDVSVMNFKEVSLIFIRHADIMKIDNINDREFKGIRYKVSDYQAQHLIPEMIHFDRPKNNNFADKDGWHLWDLFKQKPKV